MITLCGVGYRNPLHHWICSSGDKIECLEITAEHFFDGAQQDCLEQITSQFSLFVHGLGLSLGSPGPIESSRLRQFKHVVERCDPLWVSEHISFTKTGTVDFGHLNPVPLEKRFAERIAEKSKLLADLCGKPVLLENITSAIRFNGELSETDFLNDLCEMGDCGLLLDVTNLYINSRNHDFDPVDWLSQLDMKRVKQLHIVGYRENKGKWFDSHSNPIQHDLWELFREVLARANVEAAIIERDANFANAEPELSEDLVTMRGIVADG